MRELHSSPTFLLSSIFAPFLTSISISWHLLSSSISLSFRSFLFSYSPLSSPPPLLFCSTLPSTSSCAFCPKFPFLVFLFYPPFCLPPTLFPLAFPFQILRIQFLLLLFGDGEVRGIVLFVTLFVVCPTVLIKVPDFMRWGTGTFFLLFARWKWRGFGANLEL